MGKKPFLIGVSGGSGSGKTFFLKSFLNHFSPQDVCLISQDDYYIPLGKILTTEENITYNFDEPSCFDEQHFTNDIKKILNGETIHKKEYNFNNPEAPVNILEIKPAPIVIVEGLFVFHFPEIAKMFDMKIFIYADENIALQRRIKRDREERGFGLENVMYKWINHIIPSYNAYILPHKDTADRVIHNNTNILNDILILTEEISLELKKNVLELMP